MSVPSSQSSEEYASASRITHQYEIVPGNKIKVYGIYTTPRGHQRILSSTCYLIDEVNFNFDSNGKFVSVTPKPNTPFRLSRQNGSLPGDYEDKLFPEEIYVIGLKPGMIVSSDSYPHTYNSGPGLKFQKLDS